MIKVNSSGVPVPMLLSSVTYYVSTTGNDSNDGLAAGRPLRTIMAAINKLPKNLNGYNAVISVADGTYQEDIAMHYFYGGAIIFDGTLNLIGRIKAIGFFMVNFLSDLNITYDPNLVWASTSTDGMGLISILSASPYIHINGNCVLTGSDDAKSKNIAGIWARFGDVMAQGASTTYSMTVSGLYCAARTMGTARVMFGGTLNINDCTVGLVPIGGSIYTHGGGYLNNNANTKYNYQGGLLVVGNQVNPAT